MTTHLYRHFDKDGMLLYVGISLSALARLSQHRDVSHWFDRIRKVEIESFGSKEEARSAEKEAVVKEKPLFNVHYKKKDLSPNRTLFNKLESDGKLPFSARFTCKVKQAVELSGMGKTKFFELLNSGAIASVKIDGIRLVRIPSLLEYLGLSTNQSTAQGRIGANQREPMRTRKQKLNQAHQ